MSPSYIYLVLINDRKPLQCLMLVPPSSPRCGRALGDFGKPHGVSSYTRKAKSFESHRTNRIDLDTEARAATAALASRPREARQKKVGCAQYAKARMRWRQKVTCVRMTCAAVDCLPGGLRRNQLL